MATILESPTTASGVGPARRPAFGRLVGPACVLALAPLPFLAVQAQALWLRPHYQFFPLVPLGPPPSPGRTPGGSGRSCPVRDASPPRWWPAHGG